MRLNGLSHIPSTQQVENRKRGPICEIAWIIGRNIFKAIVRMKMGELNLSRLAGGIQEILGRCHQVQESVKVCDAIWNHQQGRFWTIA